MLVLGCTKRAIVCTYIVVNTLSKIKLEPLGACGTLDFDTGVKLVVQGIIHIVCLPLCWVCCWLIVHDLGSCVHQSQLGVHA